ncbi:hypothetical protein [Clostridium sp. CAG:43]|uniref:hypothetical protein n=1 Tax=Clostridium sp. CAG:43 TaxID=1262805 RepID=UPI000338C18E|nr:hypothetical protein [Clostridium sp. CAG:43]CDD58922.1 uncharacterized protein BN653_02113 [Clostridium sp. CAG:43]
MLEENIIQKYRIRFKNNQIPLELAFLQWFVTSLLQIDRAFFYYDSETKYFFIVKLGYFICLVFFWKFVLKVYAELKQGNDEYIRGRQIFLVYFTISMILLLIFWPGIWAWDDLYVLQALKTYQSLAPWQHVITGLYQDILLQILPFPGGIILIQNIIISVCVAFSVTKLERIFHIRKVKYRLIDSILKCIPFLLPPILSYQYSGYRIGIYIYLELTFIIMSICIYEGEKEWNYRKLLMFCFLSVIVACWRTESFIYIPFICILFLFVRKEKLSRKKKFLGIMILILGFIGMTKWQKYELGNQNYEIVATLRPCVELVRHADLKKDESELKAINEVLDLEIIYENPEYNGEQLYWSTGCVRTTNDDPSDDFTEIEYKDYLRAFLKLSIKYPKVVINERGRLFLQSIGVIGSSVRNTYISAVLFDDSSNKELIQFQENGWLVNRPVYKTLRKYILLILGGVNTDGSLRPFQSIIWNAVLPISVLCFVWLKLLLQRKWYLWLLCSAIVAKIPIVILTEPSNWVMYFLSFYFLGYILITYGIWMYLSRKE